MDAKVDTSSINVTTGPIQGSHKHYVETPSGLKVAMRAIPLEPSSGEADVVVYDPSGPYTDSTVEIDIKKGLTKLRHDWIMARGDVEAYDGRDVKPEDNGKKATVPECPAVNHRPLRATGGQAVSQLAYAKRGIVTPEMEYVAVRENEGRMAATGKPRDGEDFGAAVPNFVTPEFVRDEIARGRAVLPVNINHPERSEEHTSELQSHHDLVCRLLLEKKKNNNIITL